MFGLSTRCDMSSYFWMGWSFTGWDVPVLCLGGVKLLKKNFSSITLDVWTLDTRIYGVLNIDEKITNCTNYNNFVRRNFLL